MTFRTGFHSRMQGRLSASESPFDARALVTTTAWLRPCAALGQSLAILAAIAWLQVTLPLAPLVAGIAVLALASPLAFWRLHQYWPVGAREAFCHLAFDMCLLGWALYFTGGASNPFVTLLLAPVALSAAALSGTVTAGVTALAAAIYAILIFWHVPLPDMPMHGDASGFRLHLIGMAVNFLIAILLLAVFIGRMRASLNTQREATRHLRERVLRDEGILAIATQAAEAAHQFNTPLSTLRTLLPELAHGRENDNELCDDVRVMLSQVERCRTILRNMAEYGQQQLVGTTQTTTLGDYIDASAERFRLLRPEAEVAVDIVPSLRDHPIEVQPGLAHALLSLMHNAFDASSQNDSQLVTLSADVRDGRVEFAIGDRGNGIPSSRLDFMPAASSKPDGLGIGLSLARSAIERMSGEMGTRVDNAGGTRILVRLPLGARVHA